MRQFGEDEPGNGPRSCSIHLCTLSVHVGGFAKATAFGASPHQWLLRSTSNSAKPNGFSFTACLVEGLGSCCRRNSLRLRAACLLDCWFACSFA